MKLELRKSEDRGLTKISWLDSRHSFSFGEYYDPSHMGFRTLRVINDDLIEPGRGFGQHGHRDMEIISIVLEGELEHKDSLGHTRVLAPGEVQVMSAGRGILHSEYNPSADRRVHLLQIWIEPEKTSLTPSYDQKKFVRGENIWVRVAGRPGNDDALVINQDAHLYLATLLGGEERKSIDYVVQPNRYGWLHIATGEVRVGNDVLEAGDAISFKGSETVTVEPLAERSELLMFDLN